MPELLNASAYGRTRGLTHTAILKAIESGRLRESVQRVGARKILIDRAIADREWQRNTDAAQQREKAKAPAIVIEKDLFGESAKPAPPDEAAASKARGDFQSARSVREFWNAKHKKAQVELMLGELVERKHVLEDAADLSRMLLSRLLPIGLRVKARVAAQSDPEKCQALIDAEVRDALAELARGFEKLAGDELEP